jgi:hypothetical protein
MIHRIIQLVALPLSLLALDAHLANAQISSPVREVKRIQADQVEIRSGPSDQFPPTGLLNRDAYVSIKRSDGSYLEIDPPPGSFSWIPKAVVTPKGTPQNGKQLFIVTGDSESDPDVPVHPGSPNVDGPLQIRPKLSVKRGTIGYIRGAAVKPKWDNRQWYPIDPLPGESRFIPVAALQRSTAGYGQFTSAKPGLNLGQTPAQMLADAEQAERSGDIDNAILLYEQLAAKLSVSEPERANYCATKVFELRRKPRTSASFASRKNDGTTTSGSAPNTSQGGIAGAATSAQNSGGLRSTGLGWLRATGFTIDNRPAFALVDQNGRIMFYATAEPGVNLIGYANHWVDLFGTIEPRGDVRGGEYIKVSRISLVR